MRVFGKLSFCVLIACLAFFVNKEVQAAKGDPNETKVNKEVQSAAGGSNQEEVDQEEQAAVGGSDQKEVDHEEQAVAGGSGQNEVDEEEQVATGGSDQEENIDMAETSRAHEKYDEGRKVEDAIDLKSEIFFLSFMQPQLLPVDSSSISKVNIVQKLDHFDVNETRTWIQRAFVDTQHEKVNGPVLLKIGDLRRIFSVELEDPIMQYLGRELHATLYILEHRYYGESYPSDVSTRNLDRFCKINQALADIDNFIKLSGKDNKKWIVFGTGYGGTLAIRFRSKYPHVASSALAFRAPLLGTFEQELTYYSSLNNFGQGMKDTVQEEFNQLHQAVNAGKYDELKIKFNMCNRLDEGNLEENKQFMYWTILNYVVSVAVKHDFDMAVHLINDEIPNELDRLAHFVKKNNGEYCFVVNYEEAITKYRNANISNESQIDYPISLSSGIGMRPHFFQRCFELGHLETTGNGSQIFGVVIDISYYVKLCNQSFDKEYNLNEYRQFIETSYATYGGRDLDVTNVIHIIPKNQYWIDVGLSDPKNVNEIIIIDYEKLNNEHAKFKTEYNLVIKKLKKWTGINDDGVEEATRNS